MDSAHYPTGREGGGLALVVVLFFSRLHETFPSGFFFTRIFEKGAGRSLVAFRFRLVFLLQRFAHVAEGNCRCRRFGRKSLYQKSEAQAQCDVFLLAHIVVQWPGTHWHAN